MDLTDIKPSAREFELITPTGDGTGIVFVLRAPDSTEVKAFERKTEDAVLRNRGKLPTKERRTFRADRIVAGVEGWKFLPGAMTVNGETEPEFTERKLRELLKVDWISRALDTEMGDETAFFDGLRES